MSENFIFTQERFISSAFIDSSLRMGIAQSVLMVQDNLTECFNRLGCDGIVYREKFNAFWVFTKTRVRFFRRPMWRETITARTFPVDNAGFKAHVNTEITDAAQQSVLTANQEVCVLDSAKHRPLKISSLSYPAGPFLPPVFTEPFERFENDFSESDFQFEQIVRSQLIDMSHHMNNIEYIKLALNTFTDDFLQQHDISFLEVHYLGESKEGETLRVFAKNKNNVFFIMICESARPVFEMQIAFKL
ncbi:MAG: thioesterase [Bacteroides sp.]|nr:thioesterase [Prevotella sp.]MCM1408902.1 thioesterase [Treponema brennaborense]MCM1470829.1 thioesterase [Bacteroides sp.]